MHPTADTRDVINSNGAARRVMPGVRLMRVNKYGFGEEDTDVSGVRYRCGRLVRLVYSEK